MIKVEATTLESAKIVPNDEAQAAAVKLIMEGKQPIFMCTLDDEGKLHIVSMGTPREITVLLLILSHALSDRCVDATSPHVGGTQ